MEYQTLKFEQRDGVAHLELRRPDAANGINLQLAEELLHAIDATRRRCARCVRCSSLAPARGSAVAGT